jgi:hypothetical protein
VPQRVLLQPTPLEYGVYRQQYNALVDDLEAEGVLVRLLPAKEERGIGTTIGAEVYDLVIQVGAVAGSIVSTAKLIEIVRHRLRGHGNGGMERHGKIYQADGDVHEFVYRDEDE